MRKLLPLCAAFVAASCSKNPAPALVAAAQPTPLLDRHVDFSATAGALTVPVEANTDLVVTVESTGFDPVLEVVPPGAEALHNDDYQGSRTRSQLTIHTTQAGAMRLAVSSFAANGAGRYHVTVRKVAAQANAPTFLAVGATQAGEVTRGDSTLPDGRAYDEIMVLGPAAGGAYELRLAARGQVVPLAVVLDPQGRSIASTGAGVYPIRAPFLHRVQVIAPAAGQTAGYTVSLANAAVPTSAPTTALNRSHHSLPAQLSGRLVAGAGNVEGDLGASSLRLPTGESADVYEIDVGPDRSFSVDAQSDDFDTYLIAIGPDGHLEENDDSNGTNAHVDLRFTTAGRARVLVSSYRAGMTGHYVLKIGGGSANGAVAAATAGVAATVATGDEIRGELATGDRTLGSGEFVDNYRRTFQRGQPIQIRLQSSDFDPYVIVRSPSGHQDDNDDFQPPDRAAGVDIPAAEDGEYSIAVTSYRSGEHGNYSLRINGGGNGGGGVQANAPDSPTQPNVVPTSNPSRPGEGHLYGIFVGISDYPEGVGDLDECANDAIKLAEALRNRGLLTEDHQVVLTDRNATLENVRSAFQRLSAQIGPNDTFLFFHSGHGSQDEGSHDVREIDGTDESIYLYNGELVDDEMGRLFDGVSAHTSILALDSCFAGGFAKDVITRPGRVGFFSSEEDVESSVASQFQAGGYLSYFLRTGVTGEADTGPRDGALTVGELEHYLIMQFGRHATDVEMAGAYQHLVCDRGAVRSTEVLWRY